MVNSFNPLRFSWYLAGRLAASAYPGRYRKLEQDLTELREQGVQLIINLHDPLPPLPPGFRDIEVINEFVPDGDPPVEAQMEYILDCVRSAHSLGRCCVVCCRGGIGRTATITAVLLMEIAGYSLEESLEMLKKQGRMPQTLDQLNFLKRWQERGRNIL